jgi:peptide/nickel transport system substrate-binding protein
MYCYACDSKVENLAGDYVINVHLAKDPQRINPIIRSTSTAREVYQYLFLPMAEYNPQSLEFDPILINKLPEKREEAEGDYAGGVSYTFEILEEAVWEDGIPITGKDYLFTLKTIMHPQVNAARWRSVLNRISDIKLDETNPKRFSVYFKKDYMLSLEACASVEIFPEHIYDPELKLRSVEYFQLLDEDKLANVLKQDSSSIAFAVSFNSANYSRDIVSGAGPYKLTDWKTDQFIVLERKENWWGNAFPERPFLQAYPAKIVLHIIADEAAAITQLKNGGLDILKGISGINYKDLESDESLRNSFSFNSPQLMRYYYLGLNNRSPLLDDKSERNAIAHLIPMDKVIESLEEGMGVQIVGDFLPTRNYYNKDLKPITYDLELANQLLSKAGWSDTDGDGVKDQILQGRKQDLVLRMHVSGSKLGNSLALILKESAASAGVKIEVVQKKFSLIRNENLSTGDFEIVALVKTQSLTPNDPYLSWHTDNAKPGGSNYFGFGSIETDRLIEQIRNSKSEEERKDYYLEFQEKIFDQQPVIFLYAPKEKIVSSNKLEGVISMKRPGYFANTFKRQDS